MKKRLEAEITGQVQGVLFRAKTQAFAQRLGLVGWVQNEDDGSVFVVAEGEEERLKKLLEFLRTGPDHAQVEKVEVSWADPIGEFREFEIRYD